MPDNKTIGGNYLDQVWRKGNLAAIDEYIAPTSYNLHVVCRLVVRV